MSQKTPTVAGKQLSSSLKDRLKRCGRYHSSPVVKTPGTRQLETSQSTTCSNGSAAQSETPSKKMCINQPPIGISLLQNEKCVTTSSSKPDVKSQSGRARNTCVSQCDVDCSKFGIPLSELQNNPDSVSFDHALPSTEKVNMSQSVFNSRYRPETIPVRNRSKTISNAISDTDSEGSEGDTNKESVKIHNACNDSSVITDDSLTSGLALNVRSTPVSSRSSLRTNQVRVNKLEFDKESERMISHTASDSRGFKPLDGDKTIAHEGRCDNFASANNSTVNKTKPEHLSETVVEKTFAEKQSLLKEISEQEEVLRKLKMVKMYRTKNNLPQLEGLILKWRDVAQQGFQDLHEALPEPKPSLTELLQHLGVDFNLVKFDPAEEMFS